MSKNNFSSKVKMAWLKSVEAIGTSASNLADNAKQKVAEMNVETRRREIISDVSMQVYELWQKGVQLPEPLGEMMQELSELDEKLSVLRAQKYAKVGDGEANDGEATDNEEPAQDNADTDASTDAATQESDSADTETDAADAAEDASDVPPTDEMP